jgi:hypothetical protein
MAQKGKGSATREKGRRAGASAPPTPCSRLRWPKAMEARLKQAGIKTEPRRCR